VVTTQLTLVQKMNSYNAINFNFKRSAARPKSCNNLFMDNKTPTLHDIIKSDACPFWVLDLIDTLYKVYPVDAANCLDVLAKVYADRADKMIGKL